MEIKGLEYYVRISLRNATVSVSLWDNELNDGQMRRRISKSKDFLFQDHAAVAYALGMQQALLSLGHSCTIEDSVNLPGIPR